MNEAAGHEIAWEARLLLRAARAGTLATAQEGAPFASLVTPATAPDGSILLLLSDLSEHTRHLRRDPRCTLMVTGAADGPNPQTAPRVSLSGTAAIDPDPALRERWVSVHPYAGFYAGFGDFNLWRLVPERGLFVAGFARAHRLAAADLVVPAAACAAVAAAEAGVVAHCNADHPDALNAIAEAAGYPGPGWRMTGCDADGFDLAHGERSLRLAWPGPVDSAGTIRDALMYLAGAARRVVATTVGLGQSGPV